MTKYLLSNNSSELLKFNKETETLSDIQYQYTNIDYMWIADEDGVISTKDGDIDVKSGDIILRMYRVGDGEKELIVVSDDKLADYYNRLISHKDAQNLKCQSISGADCCKERCC